MTTDTAMPTGRIVSADAPDGSDGLPDPTAWHARAVASGARLPYCGPGYLRAVLQSYHGNQRAVIVSVGDARAPRGLMALVKRPLVRLGRQINEWGFPFNPNTILNDPLVSPGDVNAATALVTAGFSTGAETLILDHLPAEGGSVATIMAAARAAGFRCDEPRTARALYYAAPLADWDSYLASRSRNHRWQINKALRTAAKAGDVDVQRISGRAGITAALPDWFAVEGRSWQGADPHSAMTDDDRMFHRRLLENLADDEVGDLWLVRMEDRPVAALRMLATSGAVSVHTMHFDAAFKARAPGLLAFATMMQAACEGGLTEVDMHGTTEFFSRWATASRPHVSLRLYRQGWRGAMLQRGRSAARAAGQLRHTANPEG